MDEIQKLKILLLESKYPLFTDEELMVFLEDNGENVYKTASELCLLKADNDKSVTVGPIKIESAGSEFWLKLSEKYAEKCAEEQSNSGSSGSSTSNKYVIKMRKSPYA